MQTMNAATNPELANQIINNVVNAPLDDQDVEYEPDINPSFDLIVTLPGGYINALGEVVTEAEIKELTGRDEEMIARSPSFARTLYTIAKQGTVRIGDEKPTDTVLDNLLAGDRDWLLLNIYAATFGREVTLTPVCPTTGERVEIVTDILKATPVRRLGDPYDRTSVVECSIGPVKVTLPTARTQNSMLLAAEKTGAELSTILLTDCITEIKGMPIINPNQVLDLSIRDRRALSEAILEKAVGPQLQEITVDCPDCAANLEVPLSLAALFQF